MMFKQKPPFWLGLLYGCIVIVLLYTGSIAYIQHSHMKMVRQTPLNQFQGAENGKKIIVEFLDYRCSYCRNIHEPLMTVLERDPDVKIVYRHVPIFGRQSMLDMRAALAAGMQGQFQAMHNILIARDVPLTQAEAEMFATRIGLDLEQFKADMQKPEIDDFWVSNDRAMQVFGVNATPTFVIGDTIFMPMTDEPTAEMFEELLEKAYGSKT